jgi:hypothetical protein
MDKEKAMSRELDKLIKVARSIRMTPEQQEQQRRSFAYGNAGIENANITREMVAEQAEKLMKGATG